MTNKELFDFIKKSPTPFHAIKEITDVLKNSGFTELNERESLVPDAGRYYIVRGGTSVIAFILPEDFSSFHIVASHTDSPCFKLKPNAQITDGVYSKLSVEKYGGAILSSWLDKPLGIAGRIVKDTENGVKYELVDTKRDMCIIPNVAPHLSRETAAGKVYDLKCDMTALLGEKSAKLSDIFGDFDFADLYLYNRQEPTTLGTNEEYIGAPRLDDLECVYTTLSAFVNSEPKQAAVFCAFDSEEIGSSTMQGANSDFLSSVLERIAKARKKELAKLLASSFLISADNAHALHPNHPELSDDKNAPRLNCGVVIKYSASRSYTTEAASAAIFAKLCKNVGVPVQYYANRADIPGGSTLGALALRHTSCLSIDIGLAQLAMHSSFECGGAKDIIYMTQAIKAFYDANINITNEGMMIL